MNEAQANKIKNELAAYAKERGLWVEITETRKPDLKDIVITVSVRVKE